MNIYPSNGLFIFIVFQRKNLHIFYYLISLFLIYGFHCKYLVCPSLRLCAYCLCSMSYLLACYTVTSRRDCPETGLGGRECVWADRRRDATPHPLSNQPQFLLIVPDLLSLTPPTPFFVCGRSLSLPCGCALLQGCRARRTQSRTRAVQSRTWTSRLRYRSDGGRCIIFSISSCPVY